MTGIRLAACGVLVIAASACGGSGGPSQEELRQALVDSGFSPAEARCFVGEMYDAWSKADREALARLDSEYEDFSDEAKERTNEAFEKCSESSTEETFEKVGTGVGG